MNEYVHTDSKINEFDWFQFQTRRTAGSFDSKKDAINCWALGLAGETGELVDSIKKHHYHGKPISRTHLVNEMGDVLWYLARLSDELEIPLSQVVNTNVEKLKLRYPEGFKQWGERTYESH